MTDSALDYKATIKKILVDNKIMQVLYEPASVDSDRPATYKNLPLTASQFNDSDIRLVIKQGASIVTRNWNAQIAAQAAADSNAFDADSYVNMEFNFRYKPRTSDTDPSDGLNPLKFRSVAYDSEGNDEIRTKYNTVAVSDSEKATWLSAMTINKDTLFTALLDDDIIDSCRDVVFGNNGAHASWDASSGVSFDWSTDRKDYYGVRDVTRLAEGKYRVFFSTPMPSSSYTVVTTVGAEDYSGVTASPRQLAVIPAEQTDSYFTVICERTDDATNEDNAYMAVSISNANSADSAEKEWLSYSSFQWNNSAILDEVQTVRGENDSDFASWLISSGANTETSTYE